MAEELSIYSLTFVNIYYITDIYIDNTTIHWITFI